MNTRSKFSDIHHLFFFLKKKGGGIFFFVMRTQDLPS